MIRGIFCDQFFKYRRITLHEPKKTTKHRSRESRVPNPLLSEYLAATAKRSTQAEFRSVTAYHTRIFCGVSWSYQGPCVLKEATDILSTCIAICQVEHS